MGIVEGVTEFLPISSTGHLIVVGDWLGFGADEFSATFEIFIQLGAILSVMWLYREKIFSFGDGWMKFWRNIFVSFLPAAVVGFFAHSYIKENFFDTEIVVITLIIGGIAMLGIEKYVKTKSQVESLRQVNYRQAIWIGVAQVFALIPGVSRSGATIMGGLLQKLDRKTATEYSFFLAIPTMLGATVFDLAKSRTLLGDGAEIIFGVGFVFAFLSAMVAIKAFMKYISTHSFKSFAWYRIGFGLFLAAGDFFNLF